MNPHHRRHRPPQRPSLRPAPGHRQRTTVWSAALMSMLCAGAGLGATVANAQQNPTPAPAADATPSNGAAPAPQGAASAAQKDQQQITVVGVRAAAETSLKVKKNADQVLDSIVADDIGKFPDNNVAESLARVTGVQIRRDSGEASSVLIRGLPDVVTLLNGREMFTTTGRYIALADVPTSMISRVDVYKSQSADQVEGGVAGVIDVRTRRPFDFKGFSLALDARAVYNDKADQTDPHVSGTVSNRWRIGDQEFGALLGLTSTRSHYHEERVFNTAPESLTAVDSSGNAIDGLTGPATVGIIPIKGDRRRDAANVAFQWRPSNDVELYAEALKTRVRNNWDLDFFVGLQTTGSNLTASTIPGTNQAATLSSTDTFTIMSTQANAILSDTWQAAVGGKWDVSQQMRLSSEIAHTKSKYNWRNPILDTAITVPSVSVSTSVNRTPYLNYSGVDLADASNYTLFGFFDRYGHDMGKSTDWRGDMDYTLEGVPFLSNVSAGLRFVNRFASSIKSYEGNSAAPSGLNAGDYDGLACLSEPTAGNYGVGRWFTPCASYLLNHTDIIREAITGSADARALDPGSYFEAKEKATAAYLKANMNFDLGGLPLTAIGGLRVVYTRATVKGNSSQDDVYTPIQETNAYTDYLPSLNLKLELNKELQARMALSRTITRPGFSQLNPGVALVASSITVDATGSAGNPALKPVKSDNADLALEWYFARAGSVYGTVFGRHFDGYIQNKTADEVYNGVTYAVTRPYNTQSGQLSGVEMGYQQFYEHLPDLLQGLGMQFNVTYMEGKTKTDGKSQGITGVSKWSFNLVGLYERGPWSGRLAYNWRDKFVDVYDSGGPGLDLIVAPTAQLDGSISYKISDALSFTLDCVNILDMKYRDYWKDPSIYPRDTRRYDRSFGMGLRWRL